MEDSKTQILLFKIPVGTPKNFLQIYIQFGQAPSKIFRQAWSSLHIKPPNVRTYNKYAINLLFDIVLLHKLQEYEI